MPIFDKDKIEAGFDVTRQFINQVGTFVNNRAKEADAAKRAANDPSLTPDQRAAAQQQADQLNAEWGPSGSYRQVLTALSVAAGGNVTGGVGQFAQAATVAYVQELGANAVKQIADSLDSDTARAALHAIVGCAGARVQRRAARHAVPVRWAQRRVPFSARCWGRRAICRRLIVKRAKIW